MVPVESAQAQILAAISPLPAVSCRLSDAAGAWVARSVTAPQALPPFDNSAMDGYAVRADDLSQASSERPVSLQVVGRTPAGEGCPVPVVAGSCVRVFTGSPLPAGADAVVMQEDTEPDPARPDRIRVRERVRPWESVRLKGTDVKAGDAAVLAGTRLTPLRQALLAALGVEGVWVTRAPVVGVLATGNELVEPGTPLQPGQIYESNRIQLAGLLRDVGARVMSYPCVADTAVATREALRRALAQCDAVVTSGGVSVGEYDFVKQAWAEVGGALEFWRVAMKPGKPFVFGRAGGKCLFGLPGNPVSALVTFLLLVRPAILALQGASGIHLRLPSEARALASPLDNPGDRRHFMRVRVRSDGRVESSGAQASHCLASMAEADGLVDVAPATRLEAGTMVEVLRWSRA